MPNKNAKRIFNERDLKIYAERVHHKKTYRSLATEFGLSQHRIFQIIEQIQKFNDLRRNKKSWLKGYNGVILDPDGIGEIQETWTAEEQYAELEWEKHGKSVQSSAGSG